MQFESFPCPFSLPCLIQHLLTWSSLPLSHFWFQLKVSFLMAPNSTLANAVRSSIANHQFYKMRLNYKWICFFKNLISGIYIMNLEKVCGIFRKIIQFGLLGTMSTCWQIFFRCPFWVNVSYHENCLRGRYWWYKIATIILSIYKVLNTSSIFPKQLKLFIYVMMSSFLPVFI